MAKCRPSKWVPWAFLGAGLPLLAAWAINSGSLTSDIATRAGSALSGNEMTAWGKVESQGRDFVLSGTAPSQEALDAAVKSVAGTYGVRTVQNKVQIVEPIAAAEPVVEAPKVVLAAPTVENYFGNLATPVFKGTWPEVEAKTAEANLEVKVGDTAYVLGKAPELKSDGAGNWMLTPSLPLLEGELNIMPTVVDKAGAALAVAAAAATATIDLTPPALPELVAPAADAKWPYAITGKWPEVAGNTLSAKVGDRVYTVNRGAALTSDGKGNFNFMPSAKFAPGSYDIDFSVNDAAGNTVVQTAKAAIVVAEAAPAVEAPAPAPAPKVLAAKPGVNAVAADMKWPYAVTGQWAEIKGNTLTAKLGERVYVVNRGSALTSDGRGKFSFAPSAKLAPGSYDVDFTVNDAAGNSATHTAVAAIVVPEPAPVVEAPAPSPIVPATPAVVDAIAADAKWPYAITGTWDEKPGHSLLASVAGRTYVLGRGAALTSDGAGKFSFAPSSKFAPGKYDVVFTTNDATSESKTTVATAAIVIPTPPPPPRPKLPSPTVVSQLDLTGAPIIKGTWPNDQASVLAVYVAGRNYVLGRDANLSAKDGNWTLFPGSALADGTYDVKVGVSNADGVLSKDETKDELVVDVTQPAPPSVMTMSGDVSPDHLSGTWDQPNAKALKISVPQVNIMAELGAAGSPLTADGAGNWRLALAQPLPVGTYNVVAESVDEHGRVQVDVSEGEVVVAAKGAEPPPAPKSYDCIAVMNRIGAVFPIRFEFDLTDITKPFDLSVSQYAALLKDPRCTSINVEVKGHADFRGEEIYNMGLSERRAGLIVKMLTDAGVDASRLSIKALGESVPLDPAQSDEARMKNRRVEITAKP